MRSTISTKYAMKPLTLVLVIVLLISFCLTGCEKEAARSRVEYLEYQNEDSWSARLSYQKEDGAEVTSEKVKEILASLGMSEPFISALSEKELAAYAASKQMYGNLVYLCTDGTNA